MSEQTIRPAEQPDYVRLAPTEKQLHFARAIAQRSGAVLNWQAQNDRRALSRWIERHKAATPASRFATYPSSKQVAFAERIARIKRSEIPPECFKDRGLLSRWIDAHRI